MRALYVILASRGLDTPDELFVEVEDEHGRSVGFPPSAPDPRHSGWRRIGPFYAPESESADARTELVQTTAARMRRAFPMTRHLGMQGSADLVAFVLDDLQRARVGQSTS
jgi:hypothetical protein